MLREQVARFTLVSRWWIAHGNRDLCWLRLLSLWQSLRRGDFDKAAHWHTDYLKTTSDRYNLEKVCQTYDMHTVSKYDSTVTELWNLFFKYMFRLLWQLEEETAMFVTWPTWTESSNKICKSKAPQWLVLLVLVFSLCSVCWHLL